MSQVTLDTDKVWDIGKASEATQKRINELSEGLQSQVKGLSHIEDFIQLYDERIERQIRRMKNEANRCGMAASYIFKIAENYERTDRGLAKGLSIFAPVLDKTRVENDAAYKKISTLTDQEKYEKALGIEYSRQNSVEAERIPYKRFADDAATARSGGCGTFAMLHLLRYYDIDKGISMKEMFDFASKAPDVRWKQSSGTLVDQLGKALHDKGYSINHELLTKNSDTAIEALKSGKPIIAEFENSVLNVGGETKGHFISIVDISEDGSHVLVINSMTLSNSKHDAKSINGIVDTKTDGIYWMPIKDFKKARYYQVFRVG